MINYYDPTATLRVLRQTEKNREREKCHHSALSGSENFASAVLHVGGRGRVFERARPILMQIGARCQSMPTAATGRQTNAQSANPLTGLDLKSVSNPFFVQKRQQHKAPDAAREKNVFYSVLFHHWSRTLSTCMRRERER